MIGENLVVDKGHAEGVGYDHDDAEGASVVGRSSNVGFQTIDCFDVACGFTGVDVAGETFWTRHLAWI